MAILSRLLLGTALAATTTLAHSHVNNLVINGVYWQGYDPTSYPYEANPPVVVGWTAGDTDNGYVAPDAYQSGDIICHKNATPAGGHAIVAAGDSISIQWAITWPDSHHGPIFDYLAPCNGNCETVDKTTLEFFKIDQVGYLSGADPGVWATDVLIADNSTWLVQIPAALKPGNYVLRHEILALHSAQSADGAQNYPQCFNLAVTAGAAGAAGTLVPSGTLGEALYSETDPGVVYNLYTSVEAYTIPGPTLYSGFPSSVSQTKSSATVTSSAVVPGAVVATGSSSGVVAATTTKSSSSVGATTTTTTSSSKSGSTASASTASSTTQASTATTTSTTLKTTTTSAPAVGGGQTLYGQCGGTTWSGLTSCSSGATCTTLNAYYAQCVP